MDDKSILDQLEARGQKAPRIDLEGIGRPNRAYDRYQIVGEIAQGTVGTVYRGRDNDIGREVALKVLREEHLSSPEVLGRFIEEAQIGGQLQHPGILPVYELGLREDGRPYFAMRLVKGETLAVRLERRTDLLENQRALLTSFREVCRAMAYAHAHGVIHRDLKPSNIMLGNFGEVLVVDWAFARVLPRGSAANKRRAEKAGRDVTVISTVGKGDTSADSVVGSAVGTPGYMPPEQAMGRIEDVDEQSDIFSLGAVLCQILTGEPAYTGSSSERVAAAKRARLEEAQARLAACKADKRLIKICSQSIEPLPKDRPRSVEALADAVAASLTASEGSAHRAQLYALQAQAQAEEQGRSRRQTVVVISVILGMVLLGAAVLLWMDAERTTRDRERRTAIESALQDATRLSAAAKWDEALAAAERAADLGEDRSLVAQIQSEQQQAAAAGRIAGADEVFLAALEEPRELYGVSRLADAELDPEAEDRAVDAAYMELFKQRFGSVVKGRDQLAASKKAPAFAACLGFWSSLRRGSDALKGSGWKSLDSLACAVDPASAAAREELGSVEVDGLLAAAKQRGEALPLPLVSEVGLRLTRLGRGAEAVAFLTTWQQRHPDDYWINVQLAAALAAGGEARPAARHAFAAVAVRPGSAPAWIRLGLYYKEAGDFVDGIYALRRASELDPGHKLIAAALRAVELATAAREATGR